jgi:hypothetical protein
MDIHAVYRLFFRYFRTRRMRTFAKTFALSADTTILDVGGFPYNWELSGTSAKVTLLNLSIPTDHTLYPGRYTFVQGDGTRLQYPDQSFDIVFSNSVIEHVGGFEDQRRFAKEVRRVGRQVWVQTPARSFFVDPHLITPFVHYLPRAWQRRLLRNFTVWGLLTRPSQERVDQFLSETRLLNLHEMRELFPDCEIRKERFAFLTKAYIAVRR